jgi:hypothetical protein
LPSSFSYFAASAMIAPFQIARAMFSTSSSVQYLTKLA